MKTYILLFSLFALLLSAISCNDEFLERYPIETQTVGTAFKSYDNFKTFSWSLYDVFTDGDITQNLPGGRVRGDWWAGYVSTYAVNDANPYRAQTAVVPTSGGGWTFNFVRKVCLMLDNIDKSNMSDADKGHWRSVGYFFHAYKYYELISRFGDVPWIESVVKESDEDIIYGQRTPRKEVADKVLERLQYAEKNIKSAGDGSNTINIHVVRTIMSHFCLFEGTWRKYHGLGDADKYLDEAIRVSEELMKTFPDVHDNYDDLFCLGNLNGFKGMIFYKEYIKDILMHGVGHNQRTSSGNYELHKATLEMYLCSDGKTISNSPLYDGDLTMYDEFRNRDRRLLIHVVPPYHMDVQLNDNFVPTGSQNPTIYLANVDPQEYVELIKQILPNDKSKRLPVFNWSGTMNWYSPNVLGPGQAPLGPRSGYYWWRDYNLWDQNSNAANLNTCDKPIYHIEQILLNYAELMFEKGRFDQTVADATINKLRPRAGVANMIVAEIDENFDPMRDKTVDPVLWEIRRERMIELLGEGFGFQDIRRWKKGSWYINRDQMGCYINKSDYTTTAGASIAAWNSLVVVNRDYSPATTEGYLARFPNPEKDGKGWKDAYYLFPIPLNDLVLNPNLIQNPGWN